ncbi:dephospho-CoA kinase [Actinopolymorpha sp. B11F2]|uniref:dephospho-CoA kinase n=1 Tax=Actinopolymorpha sp. B11F2 TaxID=3160862 RepID=UPI0032E3DF8A
MSGSLRGVLRVGLTGGIGSGKSEVARVWAGRGALVVDADRLAREVVEVGTDGLASVVQEFGGRVVRPDGSLDRAALGEIVFADAEARRRLEAIVHPRVRARAADIEAAADRGTVVVHVIPLLVETGQADRFDVVVVVDVPEDVQVERLRRTRGMTAGDARSRIAAQAGRDERLAAADIVIDNAGDLDDLRTKADSVWAELEKRAASA